MGKISKPQAGFSAVEAMIIILVLAVVAGAGYLVYKNHHKTKTTTPPISSTTKTTMATKTATTADPYAGWKSYCDTATSGCFKYSSDWNDVMLGTDVTALGGNKGETLTLEYNEPADANGSSGDFLTKSISPVTIAGSSYDIVGGYYTVSNVPGYYLVDSSLAQQLGLKAGTNSTITNNDLYFTFASKKATFVVHYNTAASGGASAIVTSTANAWFTSADGKAALSTVQSFYKQ